MASTAITERRRGGAAGLESRRRSRRGTGPSAGCREDGAASLEELVLGTLVQLEASGRATCPVCSEPRLEPSGCGSCGSAIN